MRTMLIGALVLSGFLSGGIAQAAPKDKEVRGCVTFRKQADGQYCRVLRARNGVHYSLHGANLPPVQSGAVILVRGPVGRGRCPLRVVLRSVEVKSWTFTRAICPVPRT